ncbi:hypothetical protein UlMin_027607 [Ulmus minor]
MVMKKTSHWWWLYTHNTTTSKYSPWLQSRYDHVKCDFPSRQMTTLGSPFFSTKYQEKTKRRGKTCDSKDSAKSEVDDSKEDDDQQRYATPVQEKPKKEEFLDEVWKMKRKMKRLGEENRPQKEQLKQEDRKDRGDKAAEHGGGDAQENVSPKRSNPFDFNKLNGTIFGNLFNGSQKHHGSIVALKTLHGFNIAAAQFIENVYILQLGLGP